VFVGAFLLARQNAADLSFYDFVPLVEFSEADRASQMIETAWWHAPLVFLKSMKESIDSKSHLQALAFSLLFGAMVGVLEAGGGMRSLIQRLSQKIKSRRGAQTMIATSGLAIFFDDYANTLLLGGTMRSTADRYRISREKLAYLVDSTAAPVAGLSVVSTWAAIEISYMGEGLKAAGIEDTSAAFQMFIQSIPFRFYPWLALAMVFTVSISGRDFGPMHRAESKVDSDGEHRGGESSARQSENDWLWIAAVLPVVLCVASVGVVLTITGLQSIDAHDSTIGLLRFAGEVLGNGDSYVALIVGGAVGLMVAVASHLLLGGCDLPVAIRAALKGAKHMTPALLILWFAWALSAMTEPNRLDTGGYLAGVLSNRLDSGLLPTVVFLIAAAMAFSTGTSWGTMAILTPLSISLALQLDPDGGPGGAVALATCGSVLAGAIFGDHCSPISDTTVLSSRASGCDHVAHVRTQLPYALIVAAICVLVGTLPSAVGFSPWLCLLLGLACIFVIVGWWGKQSCETKNFV
jgi:Na+/H+ antiporter NhaC